jgi:hypothetical protein
MLFSELSMVQQIFGQSFCMNICSSVQEVRIDYSRVQIPEKQCETVLYYSKPGSLIASSLVQNINSDYDEILYNDNNWYQKKTCMMITKDSTNYIGISTCNA